MLNVIMLSIVAPVNYNKKKFKKICPWSPLFAFAGQYLDLKVALVDLSSSPAPVMMKKLEKLNMLTLVLSHTQDMTCMSWVREY